MSNDKRLGANPLDWVSSGAADKAGKSPFPKESLVVLTTNEEDGNDSSHDVKGILFSIPHSIQKEDLMGKGKIKIKKTLDTSEAIAHLEDFANSLSKGVVKVESGDESILLTTAESMKFEMKLSRKKNKAKCSIEMEWEDDGSKTEDFSISG
jgi:amphi-Trp domain-containing protein